MNFDDSGKDLVGGDGLGKVRHCRQRLGTVRVGKGHGRSQRGWEGLLRRSHLNVSLLLRNQKEGKESSSLRSLCSPIVEPS